MKFRKLFTSFAAILLLSVGTLPNFAAAYGGGGGGGGITCNRPTLSSISPVRNQQYSTLDEVSVVVGGSKVDIDSSKIEVNGEEMTLNTMEKEDGSFLVTADLSGVNIPTGMVQVSIYVRNSGISTCARNFIYFVEYDPNGDFDGGAVADDDDDDDDDDDSTGGTDPAEWSSSCLTKLQEAGVIQVGDFHGRRSINRAEAAKIVLLAHGVKIKRLPGDPSVAPSAAPYFDCPVVEWYAGYVSMAKSLGIVKGYNDGSFRPGKYMTRAEAVKILMRGAGYDISDFEGDDSDVNIFTDVNPSDWHYGYITEAYNKGFVDGYSDGSFRPDTNITRDEFIVLVCKIFGF